MLSDIIGYYNKPGLKNTVAAKINLTLFVDLSEI